MSFSCGSDDDGSSSSDNVLTFDGTEYQLKAGIIEDYGEYSDGVYNFDISLVSSEITILDDYASVEDDTFSGVYFELFTDNSEDLEPGTYSFGSNVVANSYTYADVYIDSTVDTYTGYDIVSGTFTVLDDGSTYEFEFEGTVDGGAAFSGYYRGTLEAIDSSDEFDRSATVSTAKRMKRKSFRK